MDGMSKTYSIEFTNSLRCVAFVTVEDDEGMEEATERFWAEYEENDESEILAESGPMNIAVNDVTDVTHSST